MTKILEDSKHISAVERAQGTLEKHGAFTGRYVVNPVNGEKITCGLPTTSWPTTAPAPSWPFLRRPARL